MAKAKRRMGAGDFDALRPFLDISAERCEAARAALVDGATLQSVADKYGWSRQAVNGAIAAVLRIQERYQESQKMRDLNVCLPPGWEKATFIAPTGLIAEFRAKVAEIATESVDKDNKPKAK